jgi:hypothetical protein
MYSIRNTYTKIGTILRRLVWPLREDDTQNREAFHIFCVKKKTILFGALHRYYLKTLKSIFEASLAQWQSTNLVGRVKVTRGHEFNSHRRHLHVIRKYLHETIINFYFGLNPIPVSMAERSKALRSGRSPVFWVKVRISSDNRSLVLFSL